MPLYGGPHLMPRPTSETQWLASGAPATMSLNAGPRLDLSLVRTLQYAIYTLAKAENWLPGSATFRPITRVTACRVQWTA